MNRFLPQLVAASLSLSPLIALAQPASPDVVISEDFESVAVGAIPDGFTKTGAIGVVEGVAHSGKHSLQIDPAIRGGRFLTLDADKVAALGGEQWGRFYYKVKLPAPSPVLQPGKKVALIHATFVDGKATSPLAHDAIDVRLAGLNLNASGQFHYLYNVQPKQRKEFGAHGTATHAFDDNWTLLEWHADYATQTYQLFVNGEEQPEVAVNKGAGNFEGSEIPEKFQTLSIGWTNYQPASGPGFTVWIDDLAIGKKRLGPVSSSLATSQSERGKVTIAIAKDGLVSFNGAAVSSEQLAANLQQVKDTNPDTALLIKVDETTQAKELALVMDACRNAGLSRFELETRD